MTFTFLHAADLHLGSPLQGLSQKDAQIAARFAAASRQALTSLVNLALERRVAFVIIAGDIYDGEWKDASIGLLFAREMARLQRANIPVYLVRGNHDAESVVTKSITLPDNVVAFSTHHVETFLIEDLRVALHGRSFPHRVVEDNWALTYPAPKPGWLNIGVLHTSCDGRPGHANYAPCTLQDLISRGYDYFALGHIHAFEILARDPWVVFPGNVQGRSIREPGEKGAVLVSVADGQVQDVTRVALDHARFALCEANITHALIEADIFQAMEEAVRPLAGDAAERLIAVRLRLTGSTAFHAPMVADVARFRVEAQAACHRAHEDIWLEKLELATEPPRTHAPSLAASDIDLTALLSEARTTPELQNQLAADLAVLRGKLSAVPGHETHDLDTIPALLAEAEALILGRAVQVERG